MMGNKLAYKPEYSNHNLQQRNFNLNYPTTANNTDFDFEQSPRRTFADDIDVETAMISDSGNVSHVSGSGKPRYIVRYRNEEERLAHQLDQTQTKLRMAIEQGQQLRAKTNRYEDELKTLKQQLDQGEGTDSQWKKKYYDLDKQYRNLKEDFDVIVARNKNGRDFLRQSKEDMELLLAELQKERQAKNEILHGSLSSLSRLSESGTKNKKAKKIMQQLEIDKHLLAERVRDLTERNQRGREYLNKLELEKRQQENIIAELETDLHNVKSDRNELMNRLGMSSSLRLHENQEYIDFSDENRPSNIGDRYQQLFENEWMDAFTELTVAHGTEEQQAIQILLDVLTISFQHCQNLASSQLDNIEKTLRDFNTTAESIEGKEFLTYLKAQRKMKYSYNVESIKMSLDSQLHTLLPAVEPKSSTKAYISAVIDFCWLLNVQDPPCVISWDLRKGEPFQTDKYRVYMHSGKLVDYIVWPVLYLHQGGVVLCKGVAQAMHDKFTDKEDETIIVTTVMPPNAESDTSKSSKSSADYKKHNDPNIEIDDSSTRKNYVATRHASNKTILNPMRIEEVEIEVRVNKPPTHSLEAQKRHTYEPIESLNFPDTEHQTEVKRPIEENVLSLDQLYAVVNKPKKNKESDFNTGRNLTEVAYEEMEFVADEECVTRF